MNRRLEGRVAVVTGAGRGLGRSHALSLAARGASVVVNDRGANLGGEGFDRSPAEAVVSDIRSAGGTAVASTHDVADWSEAESLIEFAVANFGDLHILINNAGILRDRLLANMSEDEWDDVVRVHLKGHAAPSRHAVAYWRTTAKQRNRAVDACIIHTTSASSYVGAFGQSNYSSAKLGVVALSNVIVSEYGAIGVRSNVVSPIASTRMSGDSALRMSGAEGDADKLARLLAPECVSAVVAWLAESACRVTGQVLHVYGGRCMVLAPATVHRDLRSPDGDLWSPEALDKALAGDALVPRVTFDHFFAEPGIELETRPPPSTPLA